MNAVTPMAETTTLPGSQADLIFNDHAFARMERMAEIMASGKATIPRHLQGNAGDCFAILMQAARWRIDPFACAQKTYFVEKSGVLAFEAQLVAAVINNNAPITGRLNYEQFGPWENVIGKAETKTNKEGKTYRVPAWTPEDEKGCGVKVWATIRGESEPRVLPVLLSQALTRNSTLWAEDPIQQLCYLGAKRWARRHCPDVIMGVYTPDELEHADEREIVGEVVEKTPSSQTSAIKQRLKQRAQSEPSPPPEPDWKAIAAKITASIASATTRTEMKSLKTEAEKLPEPWQTPVREAYNARAKELAARAKTSFDTATGEILNQEPPEHADWIAAMDECQTPEQLAELMLQMPEDVRTDLTDQLAARAGEFARRE